MPKWTFLGGGAYNNVYINEEGTAVLKTRKLMGGISDTYDNPERSVRLYRELNPDLTANVVEFGIPKEKGWVCTYIPGRQASDVEIANALIAIFNNTGRIILDAFAPKNFITTPSGRTVCVDVGMALELEHRDEGPLPGRRIRRKSLTSLDAWKYEGKGLLSRLEGGVKAGYPFTVTTIKALLFIKLNRPDICDVNFLSSDGLLYLASAFDSADPKALIWLDSEVARRMAFAMMAATAYPVVPGGFTFLGAGDVASVYSTEGAGGGTMVSVPACCSLPTMRGDALSFSEGGASGDASLTGDSVAKAASVAALGIFSTVPAPRDAGTTPPADVYRGAKLG